MWITETCPVCQRGIIPSERDSGCSCSRRDLYKTIRELMLRIDNQNKVIGELEHDKHMLRGQVCNLKDEVKEQS